MINVDYITYPEVNIYTRNSFISTITADTGLRSLEAEKKILSNIRLINYFICYPQKIKITMFCKFYLCFHLILTTK